MLKGDNTIRGVSSCYNLKIHIIVIGYKKKGESIVVVFEDTEKPIEERAVYSVVIDSFFDGKGKKKLNITDEYLRKFKIGRTLSMLVWTHPHLDHSKGIKHILSKYTSEKTKVISSPHFFNRKDDIISVTGKENIDAVKEIFESFRFKHGIIGRPSVMEGASEPLDMITFSGMDGTRMNVSLDAIAPITSIIDGYKYDGKSGLNPNEVSISFILNVDDCYFLFAGDTLDNHFLRVNQMNLKNCRFIKIPHHASRTSSSLIGFLDDDIVETACVTRFKSGNSDLPNQDVINGYLGLTPNVFSTGDGAHEKERYGIIEYEYILHKDEPFEINVNLYGNAYLCKAE